MLSKRFGIINFKSYEPGGRECSRRGETKSFFVVEASIGDLPWHLAVMRRGKGWEGGERGGECCRGRGRALSGEEELGLSGPGKLSGRR